MEDNKLPLVKPVSTEIKPETLEYAEENKSVASFTDAQKSYPLESLEVHAEGSPVETAVYTPGLQSVPFSRRKATTVSIVITVLVVLLTGVAAALFINRDKENQQQAQLDIDNQDIALDGSQSSVLPELQGAGEALLVNGDIITRGQLKVISGDFTSIIRTQDLSSNQELVLPDESGTICLDTNNCDFTDQAEFDGQAALTTQLQAQVDQIEAQLGQIVVPPAGVTSLNNQNGAVTIQGTLNRISVTTANGVITLTTPQALDTNADVQFGNLTLGAGGAVSTNTLQQTAAGNNVNIDARNDSIVFTSNGRTYQLPAVGAAAQTICTTIGNCGGGGGSSVTDVNGETGSITVQGTANQVNVSTGAGTITFSTPQNINTTSSPTFAALTLTGLGSGNVRVSGGVLTTGAINLATEVTGTLGVGNGGTGTAVTPTNGQLLIGNGAGYSLATLTQGAGVTVLNAAGSITVSSTLGTAIDSSEITDGTILEVDLASTNAPTDNFILSYDQGTGGFTWVDPAGGARVDSLNSLTGDLLVQGTTGLIDVTDNGLDTITLTLDPSVSLLGQTIDLTTEVTGILPIANGGTGANTLNDLIALGSHTTGNYVATISNGNGITGSSATESGTPTIALGPLTANWDQTGAFDIVLNNAGSELQILESTGGAFYGVLDVGDLSSNQTYTFVQGGTVITSGNVSSFATTGVTAGAGLTGGGTTGVLTLDITSGNGGIVVNANDIALTLEANQGLEVDSSGLSLISTCGDGQVLKYEITGGTWGCANDAGAAGTGDDISVNSTAATGANFLNGAASGTSASTTWSLNTTSNPDDITLVIGNASGTEAGAVTTGIQTFAGAKTFNGQITADAGINLGTQTLQGTTAAINFNNFDVTGTGDVTAAGVISGVGVNAGSGLLQGTGGLTVAGTVTLSSLTNGFLEVNGSGVVSVGTIDLGTDTSGNYVATITAGNGISGSSATEGGTPTIALSNLTADWLQSGAFDITLDNAGSELKIKESVGDTFYAILDVSDLSADQTFTLSEGGTVVTSGNVANHATTGVTAGAGLVNGGTIGVLNLDIVSGNGGIVVNANDIALTLEANKGLEVDTNGLSLIDCATDQILKYNGSNQWACAVDAGGTGVGDDVSVNGTGATGANFLNGAASGTSASTTWSLNTTSNPDDITLVIGNASGTEAGAVTTGIQTFAGQKTFNGQIVANAGINLGTQTLQGTTAVIDFTNFDVASNGNITLGKEAARTIKLADSTTANTAGAVLSILGANSNGTADGGAVTIQAGTSTSASNSGGALNLTGGDSNNAGGNVNITGGVGTNFGGTVYLNGGTGAANGAVNIQNSAFSFGYGGNLVANTGFNSGAVYAWAFDASNASTNGLSIDVQSSSSSQYPLLVTSNNGATTGLAVRADGNVGIGTSAPVRQLQINDPGTGNGGLTVGSGTDQIQVYHDGGWAYQTMGQDEYLIGHNANTYDHSGRIQASKALLLAAGNYNNTGGIQFRMDNINGGGGTNTLIGGFGGDAGFYTNYNTTLGDASTDIITLTGATNINTTGTANTAIGNVAGTFALTSSALNVTTAGAVSGVSSLNASGIINTSGGSFQTAGITRIDNSGNLTNIGNLTGVGTITIASSGVGNDVIVDGTDQFVVQDASLFNSDVDYTFTDTENLSISSTMTGTSSTSVLNSLMVNNTSSGTQNMWLLQNGAGSGTTDGLLVLDNADTDTAVGAAIVVTSDAGGITNGIDVSDADITNALLFGANDIIGTNFTIAGATGATTIGGNVVVQGGSATLGTTSQQGSLVLHDGNGQTATLSVGSGLTANTLISIPTAVGATDTFCLATLGNCFGSGTGNTLQAAYDAGNTIVTTDGRDIAFTISDTTTDPNFLVNISSGSTGRFAVQGAGTDVLGVTPTQVTVSQLLQTTGNTILGDGSGDTLTITGTTVAVLNNLNFDSNTLFVDSANDSVAVGTNTVDAKLTVNHTSTSTTAATERGLSVTVADTGNVSSDTDTTYGGRISVTRTGGSGSGVFNTYGLDIQGTGSTAGTSTLYGLNVNVSGADTNYSAQFQGGAMLVGTATAGQNASTFGGPGSIATPMLDVFGSIRTSQGIAFNSDCAQPDCGRTGYFTGSDVAAHIYSTNLSGSGTPFTSAGNLVIQGRSGSSARGIFFATGTAGTVAARLWIEAAGNTRIAGSFIPSAADTYDLGGTSSRFNDLYIGGTDGTTGIKLGNSQQATITYQSTPSRLEIKGSGAQGSLFIEDKLYFGMATMTITDDAVDDNLQAVATYYQIDVDETADGTTPAPVLTIDDISTYAREGQLLIITNTENDGTSAPFTINTVLNTVYVPGGTVTLDSKDSITLIYDDTHDYWVTLAYSNN